MDQQRAFEAYELNEPYNRHLKGILCCLFFESLKNQLPPGHWLGDILKVMFGGDPSAAERLIDNYYSENQIIAKERKTIYNEWMRKRLAESGYTGGKEQYKMIWREIALPALYLAITPDMSNPEKELDGVYWFFEAFHFSNSDIVWLKEFHKIIHQSIRRDTRKRIESDLTDGLSFDRIITPTIMDAIKSQDGCEIDIPGETITNINQYFIDNQPDKISHELTLINLLNDVRYEDKTILLCPPGEMGNLAKRLGRTTNALYQRKNVLIDQLKKRTKSPPKIPKR